MENKIITREAVVRQLTPQNIENREAEFVVSTEAIDTFDTVFLSDGWDLRRYNQNPIVAYGHRTCTDNPDMIIGTSTIRIENKQLIGTVRFEPASVNPMAEKIWQKVQAGTLRMASVGANPIEYRWGVFANGENPEVIYFVRSELLEWSIVPIGSNPEALKRSVETVTEVRATLIKEIEVTDAKNANGETINLSVRERQHKLNLKKSF